MPILWSKMALYYEVINIGYLVMIINSSNKPYLS